MTNLKRTLDRNAPFFLVAVLSIVGFGFALDRAPSVEEKLFPVSGEFSLVDVVYDKPTVSFRLHFTRYRQACTFQYLSFFDYNGAFLPFNMTDEPISYPKGTYLTRKITLWLSESNNFTGVVRYRCPLEPWFSIVHTGPLKPAEGGELPAYTLKDQERLEPPAPTAETKP